ncbi:MAG: DNA adenine methylase [Alphaproteobacteria bacterium]|nr:DNA adenine methylase [Alphaproteobacteria bacterium]
MNYIGSKKKLLKFIEYSILDTAGDIKNYTFCDLFAGTGTVAKQFKTLCHSVITNDIEYYSYIINRNIIGISEIMECEHLIDELNQLKGIDGFIYNNYCMGSNSKRNYFTDKNGRKIDAIRVKIKEWKNDSRITENQYYHLLASLLESVDKVANVASVYGAFLKKIKKSASNEIKLKSIQPISNNKKCIVYNKDANELIKNISGDILYLDPPYNARQYGANYHILNTIAKYDYFVPKGITGLRNYITSDYCRKNVVKDKFEDLIKNSKFQYIYLSYSNEGLMSLEEIENIMSKYGKYEKRTMKFYPRFKADKNREYTAETTTEYLHILKKEY